MEEMENQVPDEEQIEALLSSFQPRPGARFYGRMESVPWRRPGRAPGFFRRIYRPLAVLAILVLALFAGAALYPPLNAVARQMMTFFMPADSDVRSVRITVPASEALSTPGPFSLSLEEAKLAAGYPLKEIAALPPGLEFSGAFYDPRLRSVMLRYSNSNQTLLFSQRPVEGVEEYASIGASAPVETLLVRGVQGEYVTGGWVVTSNGNQALLTATPGTQVSVGLVWDPELPQRILRWQEDDMLYQILASGEDFSKETLLELAESME